MPEHAHVLIFPPSDDYSIAHILKAIKQPVSQRACAFLRKRAPDWLEKLKITWPNGRIEYRFWAQGGGYDRNVTEPKTALASLEYIHNNPVRRGLVKSAQDWPWSSAAWYAGEENVKLRIDALRQS
jgi:putative transposase